VVALLLPRWNDFLDIMQDEDLIVSEVVDFVDFLADRDERLLVDAAPKASEPAFAAVWDNPGDAKYDRP